MTIDIWRAVRTERQDLTDLLDDLDAQEWETTSFCTDWRVRDVVGHLTSGPTMTAPRMFKGMVRSGFRINRFLSADGRQRGSRPVDMVKADFASLIPSQHVPPRLTPTAMLTDIVVHQLDIRRPLGRPRPIPEAHVVAVGDYVRNDRFLGGRSLSGGIRFRATDAEWTAGDGPEVAGPAEALLLTMTRRFAALDELDGEGLPTLKARV
jgi:uncharacterized protein (TIGR03083 family)